MHGERLMVRFGIPALLVASCAGAAAVSCHADASEIPSFAFRSHVVLAVQLALLFFYAGLLLLVPVVRALVDGDLPIELSWRGARWREGLVDFGASFVARLENAEEEARQADLEVRKEVELSKTEMVEADLTLEGITDHLLERIVALEKERSPE